jgi:hypothetical protein
MSGTIYAVIWLVNNSNTCLSIPFSGASTPDAWGTDGDTQQNYPGYVVMPDGTPPRILAPGQTMLFGTKSDGGFGAMSGTGGSLSIPFSDGETASMSWSVPWSYFNGLGGSAAGSAGMSEPGFPAPQPFTINGGCIGCSPPGYPQACSFVFTLAGGPPGGLAPPPNQLPPGVCISLPTSGAPGSSSSPGIHSLASPDGLTTLTFQEGKLVLLGPSANSNWSSDLGHGVVAQMRTDGNFVMYDASADVIWQTNTSGHPGAYLSVDPGTVSVLYAAPGSGSTQTLWTKGQTPFSPAIVSLLLR